MAPLAIHVFAATLCATRAGCTAARCERPCWRVLPTLRFAAVEHAVTVARWSRSGFMTNASTVPTGTTQRVVDGAGVLVHRDRLAAIRDDRGGRAGLRVDRHVAKLTSHVSPRRRSPIALPMAVMPVYEPLMRAVLTVPDARLVAFRVRLTPLSAGASPEARIGDGADARLVAFRAVRLTPLSAGSVAGKRIGDGAGRELRGVERGECRSVTGECRGRDGAGDGCAPPAETVNPPPSDGDAAGRNRHADHCRW